MGMAAGDINDYIYSPSNESIASLLRQLESHGRERTILPSTIKWKPLYADGAIKTHDFKESWMDDFPVGAQGERHAKWYATNTMYDITGKGIRRTPRGGNWNLRATVYFDDDNRKIEKNHGNVALSQRQLQYRKGKEPTPWKMIEFKQGEPGARFAICKIFPVSPVEHAAGVPSPGAHPQEAQRSAEAAQDETAMRSLGNAWNAGPSPNQATKFFEDILSEPPEELHLMSLLISNQASAVMNNCNSVGPNTLIPNQSTKFFEDTLSKPPEEQHLDPSSVFESRDLLDLALSNPRMPGSSHPSKDMNHQGAWNASNITNRMDHLAQDPSGQNMDPCFWSLLDYSCSPKGPSLQFGELGGNSEDPEEWPEQNEYAFLRILDERIRKDSNRTPSFNQTDWQEINEELSGASGKKYGIEKIKEKHDHLRTKFCQFSELLEHSGVTYDPNSNTVIAADDIWQSFFQKHKNFEVFRKYGCKNYEMLKKVFNNPTTTGNLHHLSALDEQSCVGNSKVKRSADEYIPGDTHINKKLKSENLAFPISATTEKGLAEAKQHKEECDPFSIENCMDALEKMKGVSAASYNKTLKRFKDLDWRKMFIKMPDARRKSWLKSL